MPNLNNDDRRVEVNGFIVRNSDGSKVTEEQIRAVRDALDYANKSPTATNVRNEAQQKIKEIVLTNERTIQLTIPTCYWAIRRYSTHS